MISLLAAFDDNGAQLDLLPLLFTTIQAQTSVFVEIRRQSDSKTRRKARPFFRMSEAFFLPTRIASVARPLMRPGVETFLNHNFLVRPRLDSSRPVSCDFEKKKLLPEFFYYGHSLHSTILAMIPDDKTSDNCCPWPTLCDRVINFPLQELSGLLHLFPIAELRKDHRPSATRSLSTNASICSRIRTSPHPPINLLPLFHFTFHSSFSKNSAHSLDDQHHSQPQTRKR